MQYEFDVMLLFDSHRGIRIATNAVPRIETAKRYLGARPTIAKIGKR